MSETAAQVARKESPGASQDASGRPALRSYRDFRLLPRNCFACGELNDMGLHLEVRLEPARSHVELTLPDRFQGWDGLIHGGIVSTILDEVMAWALVEQDSWGVTARMSVEFRRPVLVGQAIRAEGWVVDVKRRVQHVAAKIVDAKSGAVLATAEATYVSASDAKRRELNERNGVAEAEPR